MTLVLQKVIKSGWYFIPNLIKSLNPARFFQVSKLIQLYYGEKVVLNAKISPVYGIISMF